MNDGCPWDCSGILATAEMSDIVKPDLSLEQCLHITRSGQSFATYQSGMGLMYETSLEALGQHIKDIVYSHVPSEYPPLKEKVRVRGGR